MTNKYRGRFAPSPSGPLHFGSLVAALGSWLDARHHQGEWLVRIEDIDPPREVVGAASDILRTLEVFGLYWDQQVTYQSSQLDYYQQILEQLITDQLVYRCTCTRKQIQLGGGVYQNNCRSKKHQPSVEHSLRLKVNQPVNDFVDCFQGTCRSISVQEDFILKRKDGLYAYMLAVVLDDHQQQISHVIRGADLLETTIQQIYLFNILKAPAPIYGHLPVAVNRQGLKLSKQNHASSVADSDVSKLLHQALGFLRQAPPNELAEETRETILNWAIQQWDPTALAGHKKFSYEEK